RDAGSLEPPVRRRVSGGQRVPGHPHRDTEQMGLRVRELPQRDHDHVPLPDDVRRAPGVPRLQPVPGEDSARGQDAASGRDLLRLRGVHQPVPGTQHRGHVPDHQDSHHALHHGHPALLVQQDLLLQDQAHAGTSVLVFPV
ncbi:unnamed protein product, partial [Ixodes hexagonus]